MADNEPNGGGGREDSDDSSRAENDPRNIGDQSEEPQRAGPRGRGRAIAGGARGSDHERGARRWRDRGHARNGRPSRSRAPGCPSSMSHPPSPEPPSGVSDDEYKWHTYKVYPSGRPDAVEFIDTYKVVRAVAHPSAA